jgi:hypothetical protein
MPFVASKRQAGAEDATNGISDEGDDRAAGVTP